MKLAVLLIACAGIVPALPRHTSERSPVIPVADMAPDVPQHAILLEQEAVPGAIKRYEGSVRWSRRMVEADPGRGTILTARADIRIPSRKIIASWQLWTNSDPALPASHAIQINFQLPSRGAVEIFNVPGILMGSNAGERGTALAGLAVKITSNFFLIGLSNTEANRQHNVELLIRQDWIHIPIVYASGIRAMLVVQEGEIGHRTIAEVLAEPK
jgi:hypothetical protein